MEKSNLQERLMTSALFVPITLAALFFSTSPYFEPFFAFFLVALTAVSLDEFYKLCEKKGLEPLSWLAKVATLFFIGALYLSNLSDYLKTLPLLILIASTIAAFLNFFYKGKEPIKNLSATLFGFVYITLPLSLILVILHLAESQGDDGRLWILYLLIVVKMTDIAAYFGGKNYGKKPLAPMISPKKTWEGAYIGFAASLLLSSLFVVVTKLFSLPFSLSFSGSLILGSLLCIFSQNSDLSESLLKRDAGVKDSSQLPGFGGMLDVVDSLLFPLPILYFWMKTFI